MPRTHVDSAWATSSVLERLVMLAVGLLSLVLAGWMYTAGHRSAFFSVIGIAAVALIAFAFTALTDEPDPVRPEGTDLGAEPDC